MKKRIIAAITISMLLVGCGEISVKDADVSELSLQKVTTTSVAGTQASTEATSATAEKTEQTSEAAKPSENTGADASADVQSEAQAEPAPADVQADNTVPDSQPAADISQKDPFAGTFYESKVGRGAMTITNIGDATYSVKVSWPGTSSGEMIYEVSGEFNGRGVMHYTDCVKKYRTTTDNVNFTEDIEYTDGTGYFMISNDGENEGITWHSDKAEDGGYDFRFIRS